MNANGRTLHPDARGLVEVPTMAGQRVTFTEH